MFVEDNSFLYFVLGIFFAIALVSSRSLIFPSTTFAESKIMVTRIQKANLSDGCYIKTKYVDNVTNRDFKFYAPCGQFQYGDVLVLTSTRHQTAKSNGIINNSKNVKIDVNIK